VTGRADLVSDCTRCVGLCCVALPFAASADFAEDKPAGVPCRHLDQRDRCVLHERLADVGYRGCAAYECFGAGQRVTRRTFPGRTWRGDGGEPLMLTAFTVVRQLHEILWYLHEALGWPSSAPIVEELATALRRTDALAGSTGEALRHLDVAAHRRRVAPLLRRAGTLARAGRGPLDGAGRELADAELAGADLAGADLRGACLRGAFLVGARLAAADLRYADLLGADLRGADVSGADLRGALYLTPPQLAAAHGDHTTRLDDDRPLPPTWTHPTADPSFPAR
jgi:hypothetical protein